MLLALLRIGEYGPSLINFFEHLLSSCLLLGSLIILIWMPLKCHFPISSLDGFLGCVLLDPQDLIVVLLPCLLGFLLGVLEFLSNLETSWVDVRRGTVVIYGLIPFF